MPPGDPRAKDDHLNDSSLVEAAHAYAALGWRVIPLHFVGPDGLTCSCNRGRKCESIGKHPVDKGWQNTPPLSGPDIESIWERRPRNNVGVATGQPSGFFVLDVDPDNGGLESAKALSDKHGKFFNSTRSHLTGSGGYHLLFAMPDFDLGNARGGLKEYPGIDIRGTGGQIVMPPSVSNKGPYKVKRDVEIAPAPDWLLDMIRPNEAETTKVDLSTFDTSFIDGLPEDERKRLDRYANKAVEGNIQQLQDLHKNNGPNYDGEPWDMTVFEVACALLEIANAPWNSYTQQMAYSTVFDESPRDPGFQDDRVNEKFRSALKTIGTKARSMPPAPPPREKVDDFDFMDGPDVRSAAPKGIGGGPTHTSTAAAPHGTDYPVRAWSDLGNARRFVDRFADRLRWIESVKKWAVYREGRWEMDDKLLAHNMTQNMLSTLFEQEGHHYSEHPEGPNGDKPSMREQFDKWCKGQQMSARIKACMVEAAARPAVRAAITDFDYDPWLLNVKNGVIDLRTGELKPHDPKLLLMQQCSVSYNPDAPAPIFHAYLERCMPNIDMRAYLKRIVGYSITGLTTEQAMFLHYGDGANGKSVYLEVMGAVMGDYGQVVPRETLLVKSSTEHPTSVARMVGKRFLQTSETARGRRLDEEMVKGLTGGEQQTARHLYGSYFDFKPTGKIQYVTNHKPRLTDAESIWRRLHLIGWPVKIADADRDPFLSKKIIDAELEGVLAWAVQGCIEWQQRGLDRPIISREDLKEYRLDQDEFGDFLDTKLVRNPTARTTTAALYLIYDAWAMQSGIRNRMTKIDFARTLHERGFERWRTKHDRGFIGLAVLEGQDVSTAMEGFLDDAS
jgi:putative DNA primase/helicase